MKASKQLHLVKQFMNVGQQDVFDTFRFHTTKVANFRLALINEEINGINELADSVSKDDIVGVIDGLSDILYVTYGAMATYGVNLSSGTDTEIFSPVLTPRGGKIPYAHVASENVSQIQRSYEGLVDAIQTGNGIRIDEYMRMIVMWCNQMAKVWNLDLVGAFEEVHNSNMSKFCKSREDAENSIKVRLQEGHDLYIAGNKSKGEEMIANYTGAQVEEVATYDGSYFIIKRAEDGKILKGTDFYEPDLSKFA